MNEEIEKVEENDQDYIKALQEMRENTVPKEQYRKLLEERSRLIDALRNGDEYEDEETVKSNDELRKIIFGAEKKSNVEMASAMLALRNNLVAEKGSSASPFLPTTGTITNTVLEEEQLFTDLLEHCLEVADGDNSVFTAEFQRHLKDNPKRR